MTLITFVRLSNQDGNGGKLFANNIYSIVEYYIEVEDL
jgi:hypothetical protein